VTESEGLLSSSRRRFWLRKLHSLTGVAPVGAFLLFHLWTNAKALGGQKHFDDAVQDIQAMPYLPVLELGVVMLPLAFHALYGVKLAFEARPNVGAYPYNRNWMYVAQRATGLLALAFIVWHISEIWLQKWAGRLSPRDFYPVLCERLSTTHGGVPLIALAYVLGVGACVFHFANGLWGFCFSWGFTISRRSQRISATVFGLVGVALFLLGSSTAIYFATGSRLALFGTPRSEAFAASCPAGPERPTPSE
jgi:succinate dehydrogenase/fumarate reductase cytochrome b subunit (b558 family)